MRKNNVGFIRVFMLIVMCALTYIPTNADSSGLSDKVLDAAKNAEQIIVFTRFLTPVKPKGGMEVTIGRWHTKEDWQKKPEAEKEPDFICYEMNVYKRKNLSDEWKRIIFSPSCIAGKNLSGLEGSFRFIKASGIKKNPGKVSGYIKLDDSYYLCEN